MTDASVPASARISVSQADGRPDARHMLAPSIIIDHAAAPVSKTTVARRPGGNGDEAVRRRSSSRASRSPGDGSSR